MLNAKLVAGRTNHYKICNFCKNGIGGHLGANRQGSRARVRNDCETSEKKWRIKCPASSN